jgi:hypothetical protein
MISGFSKGGGLTVTSGMSKVVGLTVNSG